MNFFPVSPPTFLRKMFGGLIWKNPTTDKKIFLTFDDGPVPEITPFVLKTLKKYNAKATFFCIGNNVAQHPELFRSVLKDGHRIGNHTQQHLNAWKVSHNTYLQDVKNATTTFHQTATQFSSLERQPLFRPPYGKITPRVIRSLKKNGYKIIMWDVLSFDWEQYRTPEECLQLVYKHVTPGSIIVFHDSIKAYKNMAAIVPQLLEHFYKKGFTFEAL